MELIILLSVGILLTVLGIINIRGNINTIHPYHRQRVTEEDVPKYGKVMGIGTLIMGIALITAFGLKISGSSISEDYIVLPAVIIGLAIMLYGQMKYNRGIF